jgi:hypothetical protein
MLIVTAIALVLLWILSFVTPHKFGAFVHLLLIAALVVMMVRFMPGVPMLVR